MYVSAYVHERRVPSSSAYSLYPSGWRCLMAIKYRGCTTDSDILQSLFSLCFCCWRPGANWASRRIFRSCGGSSYECLSYECLRPDESDILYYTACNEWSATRKDTNLIFPFLSPFLPCPPLWRSSTIFHFFSFDIRFKPTPLLHHRYFSINCLQYHTV